jgi:hypothetical protein
MTAISEKEFARICCQIRDEREVIYKHNPIGTQEETLLWMLMSVLVSYLSLSEQETPCFPGAPTAETYRHAILFILHGRADFEAEKYLDELVKKE